jgi:hypothetical protein
MKRKNSDIAPLSEWAGRWADYNLYQRYGKLWRFIKCYRKLKQYFKKLRKDFLVNYVSVHQKKEAEVDQKNHESKKKRVTSFSRFFRKKENA